jgi:drug/metabolite transporter (DMT)-like permease
MEHVGPFWFVAIRSVLACLALAPLAWRECHGKKGRVPRSALLRVGIAAGVAFFGAAALQQTGLVTASVTNCGFLTALYVVITPFLAWLMLGQRPGPWIWMAAALSFFGTWLLGGGSLAALSRGDWLVAASALLWALHVVITGIGARLDMVTTFTAVQFVVVALLAGITASFLEPLSLDAMVQAAPDLLYVGILSSALTFTLLAMALRATRAAEATVILSTESLFAAFGAFLFLGERLQFIGWLGAGTIFIATMLVQMPAGKKGRF